MNNYPFVFIWLLIWLGYYAVLNLFLIPHGFSYNNRRLYTSSFAFFVSMLVYYFFSLGSAISGSDIFLVLTLIVIILHLVVSPLNQRVVARPRKKSPLAVKYLDVIFQQLMVFSLIVNQVISSFLGMAGFFLLVHLPIVFVPRKMPGWKMLVIFLSFFGGGLFFFTTLNYGLVYSIFIHTGFYFLVSILTPDESPILP